MGIDARMLLSRGTALLLTLCLLLAPLCVTRCNVASCLPGMPQSSTHGCHQHFANNGNSVSFSPVLPAYCQTADSLFITLPGQQVRLLQSLSNHDLLIPSAEPDSLPAETFAGMDPLPGLARDTSPGCVSIPPIVPLRL